VSEREREREREKARERERERGKMQRLISGASTCHIDDLNL
jgi:hypothetical protein